METLIGGVERSVKMESRPITESKIGICGSSYSRRAQPPGDQIQNQSFLDGFYVRKMGQKVEHCLQSRG